MRFVLSEISKEPERARVSETEGGKKMSEKYWIEKGKTYLERFTKKSLIQRVRYWTQEQVIVGALNQIKRKTKVRTILDAGCGFGRITRILCLVFPYAVITGIDISEDQLKEATVRLPRVRFWKRSVLGSDKSRYDLTVAVELLMHIEPEYIRKAIRYLARPEPEFIVSVDWWTEDEVGIYAATQAGFCYLHDYEKCFRAHGYELKKEKKVPYVNQKLRVWVRVK